MYVFHMLCVFVSYVFRICFVCLCMLHVVSAFMFCIS
jgi:hypothetical protein